MRKTHAWWYQQDEKKRLGGGWGGVASQTNANASNEISQKKGGPGMGRYRRQRRRKGEKVRICDTRHKLAPFLCALAFLGQESRTVAQLPRRCSPTAAESAPVLRMHGIRTAGIPQSGQEPDVEVSTRIALEYREALAVIVKGKLLFYLADVTELSKWRRPSGP
jgi:hypothetical protein